MSLESLYAFLTHPWFLTVVKAGMVWISLLTMVPVMIWLERKGSAHLVRLDTYVDISCACYFLYYLEPLHYLLRSFKHQAVVACEVRLTLDAV